jgi:hypothetical protein
MIKCDRDGYSDESTTIDMTLNIANRHSQMCCLVMDAAKFKQRIEMRRTSDSTGIHIPRS